MRLLEISLGTRLSQDSERRLISATSKRLHSATAIRRHLQALRRKLTVRRIDGYFHAQSSVITNYQKRLDTTKVYCVLSMLIATNHCPFFHYYTIDLITGGILC